MTAIIEALYIFDEHNKAIVEQVYRSRPPSPKQLVDLYLAHPPPRPSVLLLPNASPSSTLFSFRHSTLLLLCPSSSETDPLAVLECLHRVVDALEDFLGAPLLAHKIENNYDIVAQILGEMCDGGLVCNTEPNALRETVEVPGLVGKLLSNVGFSGSAPALGSSSRPQSSLKQLSNLNAGPAIPWRRSNVRHTSNELYVDIIESISVILAPSGNPLSAIATGSIAFTAKISGVPDLLLNLSAPGGISTSRGSGIARTMQLPVFHPCVRLSRWKENPGELSFVPPDGRFVLAGYEVDLLPRALETDKPPSQTEKLFLPASVDMRTSLGPLGSDFEARLTLNTSFPGSSSTIKSNTRPGLSNASVPSFSFGGASSGSSTSPILEAVVVQIPIPKGVRNVTDLRASRGDATFVSWDYYIEWRVPTKDTLSINGTATLYGSIVGPLETTLDGENELDMARESRTQANPLLGYYDEGSVATLDSYKEGSSFVPEQQSQGTPAPVFEPAPRKREAYKALMPRSIAASFNVRGWLPSGIKVDGLVVDAKRSKGLGDGVKPYKGVKYLTVSKKGVERRI